VQLRKKIKICNLESCSLYCWSGVSAGDVGQKYEIEFQIRGELASGRKTWSSLEPFCVQGIHSNQQ
jgi:hypothetical protein